MIARAVALALLLAAVAPAALAQPVPPPLAPPRPDQTLAVTDLAHPNPERKQKAYRDRIVAGVAAAAPGYKLLERKDGEPSSSWTIDLVFERTVDAATQVVAMRLFLVHDRTLILTIATPAATWPAAKPATMKLLRGFKPQPR